MKDCDALLRLQGTQIETNIVTGGTEQLDIFSVIDRARIVRETRDGRMQEIEVKLSDWVFNALQKPGSADFASQLLSSTQAAGTANVLAGTQTLRQTACFPARSTIEMWFCF